MEECKKCHQTMTIEADLEPTDLCHTCAQELVPELLMALKKAERCLTELYPSEPCKAEHEAEYYAVNRVLNDIRAVIRKSEVG